MSPYVKQTWVDNSTPVDKVHMDHIEDGIVANDTGKVASDSVVVAGTRILASKLVASDAQPAFQINGDGTHSWGPGGATAPDTTLYRGAANELRTDSYLESTKRVYASFGLANGVEIGDLGYGAGLRFGSAVDTNLYRAAANQLKTDGQFRTGTDLVSLAGDIWSRFGDPAQVKIGNNGSGAPGVLFGNPADVNLYRYDSAGAGLGKFVRTDQGLWVGAWIAFGTDVVLWKGTASRMDTNAGINLQYGALSFGTAADTNLYRSTANTLKTDGYLQVGGTLSTLFAFGVVGIDQSGFDVAGRVAYQVRFGAEANPKFAVYSDGTVKWGIGGSTAVDTSLYRSSAGVLMTGGLFMAVGEMIARQGDFRQVAFGAGNALVGGGPSAAMVAFGSPPDTTLYRAAAGLLATDQAFAALGATATDTAFGSATSAVAAWHWRVRKDGLLNWGDGTNPPDTTLYRASANNLKTDGSFSAGQSVIVDTTDGGNRIYFGSLLDTHIRRVGAGALELNGSLALNPSALGVRTIVAGAADSGGAGFRMLRVAN